MGALPGGAELVRLEDAGKTFPAPRRGDGPVRVFERVHLAVNRGELVLVEGSSGAGKSTLLGLAGLLWKPTAGRVLFLGRDVGDDSKAFRNRLRRDHVGFVFQNFQLFERLPAWESVAMPLQVRGTARRRRLERAFELLDELGLGGREHHRTEQLSGGEQQRVALARALVAKPDLVIADEPLSNADPASAERIVDRLETCLADGAGLLVASHDRRLSGLAARRIDLDGKRCGR